MHNRRVCPGVHVAEKSLFIVISRIVWGFNIRKKIGHDGRPIEPTTVMMPGFLSIPTPFECDITPRSPERAKLIREAYAQSQAEGLHYRE